MDTRKCLGISMGDPAGIGAEIVVKALANNAVYEKSIPVVIGDAFPLSDAIRFCGYEGKVRLKPISSPQEAIGEYGTIEYIPLGLATEDTFQYKQVSASAGEAAFQYVITAISLAMERKIDAIVTGPINKESIHLAGHLYSGHTEILADYTRTEKFAMLLISDRLRVIHVTTHVSMENACKLITESRVYDTIRLAQESMRLLGISTPRIGVAGFNAHASENGLFGDQEAKAISPAIRRAQAEGMDVEGPVPPDTVFVKALSGKYDVVVAMYHDQGHIPLKLAGFKLDLKTNRYTSMSGINCTIGLPIIRTSVDHGTAFGKAGEGRANEESMLEAIDAAVTIANNTYR